MPGITPSRLSETAVHDPATVENLQALRGMAALLVLWAHLRFPLKSLCHTAVPFPLIHTDHGAIGVDLFFIISGYVISLTACKRHAQPLDFFLARVARVSPLYLAVFFLLPFSGIYGDRVFGSWPAIGFHSAWNWIFYLPIFDWRDYSAPPMDIGWTLSFEMWFYVAFALLLNVWRPAKVAFYLPMIFSIGAVLMTLYHGAWYFPRFMFHPFVLEFALGCVVFHTRKWVCGRMSWFLIAVGVVSMLAFSRHTGFLGLHVVEMSSRLDLAWLRVLLWGLPMVFIVAGLVGLERNDGYVLPRVLVWVGGISYSLYLTHAFSMAVVVEAGPWIGLQNPSMISGVILVFSVSLAWLCWRWIERPLTSFAQCRAKKITHPARPEQKAAVVPADVA